MTLLTPLIPISLSPAAPGLALGAGLAGTEHYGLTVSPQRLAIYQSAKSNRLTPL
jgi:hypothetical protein